MSNIDIISFREKMDNDKIFIYHRRLLLVFSTMLLAIGIGGARILEANTFVFKIDFNNPDRLNYILVGTVIYFIMRYYAYAEEYRVFLTDIALNRLINHNEVFHFNPLNDSIEGLLGKNNNIYYSDDSDILTPKYIASGCFRRCLTYRRSGYKEGIGNCSYTERVKLNDFDESWTRLDFIKLLVFELKFTVLSILKHREYLDIMFPYFMGVVSISIFYMASNN